MSDTDGAHDNSKAITSYLVDFTTGYKDYSVGRAIVASKGQLKINAEGINVAYDLARAQLANFCGDVIRITSIVESGEHF